MIKVILVILGVAHLKPLWVAQINRCKQIIGKRKDQKTETHLLSDDEVDELAVLLGIDLYCSFLYGWHIRNSYARYIRNYYGWYN